ncbi:MAG: aminopeptidase [Promethearchaeota archaeon]|jgi:aminopeptidase
MYNPNYEKLAKIVVEYSLEVEKGHEVLVIGPAIAKEMFQALNVEILKAGAHSVIVSQIEGIREAFFKYASEEQLEYVNEVEKAFYQKFDRIIQITADYNTRKYSMVKPERMSKFRGAPERKELTEFYEKRVNDGELKWVIVPFPCNALAQEANMDLFTYSEFVFKSLFLDKENPVEEWRKIQKEQDKVVEYLNNVERIQVLGEDTDLTLSVKGRTWENCSGQANLPDGEVFTGPVEDSVNGKIRFTYPGIYFGQEIEDIYLEFKDGEVVKATAKKGEELLGEILKIENAKKIGEFAIGTNYGVTKFTKNMLFDEKMGGTMHCALGLGFENTGSKNTSPIHWDMLKDMKVSGSKILADGKVIYEEGKWKINI